MNILENVDDGAAATFNQQYIATRAHPLVSHGKRAQFSFQFVRQACRLKERRLLVTGSRSPAKWQLKFRAALRSLTCAVPLTKISSNDCAIDMRNTGFHAIRSEVSCHTSSSRIRPGPHAPPFGKSVSRYWP